MSEYVTKDHCAAQSAAVTAAWASSAGVSDRDGRRWAVELSAITGPILPAQNGLWHTPPPGGPPRPVAYGEEIIAATVDVHSFSM